MAKVPPRVSVVMPVHNALPFLDEAVESMLNQTFSDFEFVILNDRSDDGSRERLEYWAEQDSRIRLFHTDVQLGLAGSSHFVVENATAPLVARMDADDYSDPSRLQRQIEVFDEHEDAVLVGTLWEGITPDGRPARSRDRWRLWRGKPFAPFTHGSIMFRRSAFDAIGGYREEAVFWEDFDLYLRISTRGKIFVVPEALYRYRFHMTNSRLTARRDDFFRGMDLLHRCTNEYLAGRDYTYLFESPSLQEIDPEKTDPYVLFVEASTRVWCGGRPAILRKVLARRIFPTNPLRARLYLFAIAGQLFPSLFLFALQRGVRVRDQIASIFMQCDRPVEWKYRP